jgi:hypothetical protein
MNRRHFLGLGLGVALVPVAAHSTVLRGDSGDDDRLSFGYVPAEGGQLTAASRLRAGDESLVASGARLRVVDYVQPTGAGSLAMDVRFQPFHDATFRAWQSRTGPGGGSNPIGLHVPIDPKTGLQFAVVRNESLPEQETSEARLRLRGDGPKLRSGYYVVALDGGRPLDWGRYSITLDSGAPRLTGPHGAETPFTYGLLSVAPSNASLA